MKRTNTKRLLAFTLMIVMLLSMSSVSFAEQTGAKKTIKLATQFTDGTGATASMTKAYDWVLATKEIFEAKYPEYEVQLEYIPGNDYPTKLMSDYTSGITHDVIMVQTAEIAQSLEVGNLLNIEPYFDKWPQEEKDEFMWNPTWEAYAQNDGLYGIPLALHTRTLAYRKDMFEAAGLDPEQPPKTLEELTEYAIKLTNHDEDVWGLGLYMGPHQASTEVVMMPLIWSLGGNIFDVKTGKATFDDPAVAKVIQWMFDCVYKYEVTPAWTLEGMQDESLLKPFLNGQFAMAFGIGNYWLADVQNAGLLTGAYPATAEVESKVGWAVVPEGGCTYANSWGVGISANCTDPDAAFKLLECALIPEALDNFIAFGGFPGRLSKYSEPQYAGQFWADWLVVAESGRTLITTKYNAVKDALTAAMQEIIISGDDSNIAEVLTRYQDEFNARYA